MAWSRWDAIHRGEPGKSATENDRIEAMLRLYDHLRNEVLVSIRFQNRVILGEAVVVGLIYGIRLTSGDPDEGAVATSLVELAAIILPPVIIVSTALWTVEQTRMMRIGNFLELLENRINEELESPCITWENWLRSGNVSHVGTIHHTAKTTGYVGFFLLLGLLGLLLYVNEFMIAGESFYLFPSPSEIQWSPRESAVFAVYVVFFVVILLMTLPIITYRESLVSTVLEEAIPSGQQWSFTPETPTSTDNEPADEPVTDGGNEENGKAVSEGETDEEKPDEEHDREWGDNYQTFQQWECCYQTDVLGLDPEDTRLSERPDAEITECPGMTSVASKPLSAIISRISGEE